MTSDIFCLKLDNFESNLVKAFKSLQSTEDLADVTLSCQGISVKAHKVILAACSPYFRSIFKENPCRHPIVILKDVLHADLVAVLNFMYHGEVLISQNNLSSFLQTVESLQVSGLLGNINSMDTTIESNKNYSQTTETNNLSKSQTESSSELNNKQLNELDIISKSEGILEQYNLHEEQQETNSVVSVKSEIEDTFEEHKVDLNDLKIETVSEVQIQPNVLEHTLTSSKSPLLMSYLLDSTRAIRQTLIESVNTPDNSNAAKKPVKHMYPTTSNPVNQMFNMVVEIPPEKIFRYDNNVQNICINFPDDVSAVNERTLQDTDPGYYNQTCPHCKKVYSSRTSLKYHVQLVHSDVPNVYSCHLCSDSFTIRDSYKRHMSRVHDIS